MNLIRQREDLKAAQKVGAISSSQLEVALSAPVFQWWTSGRVGQKMTDTEHEFIKENLMDELEIVRAEDGKKGVALWPKLTPYPAFRISQMDYEVYEQWWVKDDIYCMFHCEINPDRKEKVWTLHTKRKSDLNYWGFAMWVDEVYADISQAGLMSADRETMVEMRIGGRSYDISRGKLSEFSGDCVRRLAWFLFDIYGAGQTVVRVKPKPDVAKSVQWHQAREHYVVLRRQQVEKLRESKGHVSDEDIARAAHWRRAHLRRLSAGRYVNKRGLLVPVRRAWVGPTEWEGRDGKVYTVVGMDNHLDKH